jgi:RNA polymerase sigma-70 factor (ECF subfamily)
MSIDQADKYLVDEIRTGSERAWQLLIERYQGRLLAFARSRIASLADAEDTVQDAFIGFLQSLGRFDSARSLETYLFTILRYKITDYLRSQSSGSRALTMQVDDWWEEATPALSESPSGVAVHKEGAQAQEEVLVDVLRRLIHELRDRGAFDDLQIIELLFYAGRRNNAVAEIFDMDEKHVAGIKFRAIQKVQKYLDDVDPRRREAMSGVQSDSDVARVWRDNRITCLKRGTLGQYLLGVLEEPWRSYTQFHLDVVCCPMCVANLEDLRAEESGTICPADAQRIYASSIGFLSRAHPAGRSPSTPAE